MLDPDAIGFAVELERFDLSLENRRRTANGVCTESRGGDAGCRARAEGGDDHAGGGRRRRQPEPADPGGDRRDRDRPDRPADPRGGADRRHPSPDHGLPDGGRRRLRRRAVARAERRRRDRVPDRADQPPRLPGRRRARVPDRRRRGGSAGAGLRRAEVDRQPGLRGNAEGGDGRRRRAAIRRSPTSRS